MDKSEPDVPTCMGFPAQHRTKLNSTNILDRLNGDIKRRDELVRIFLNEATITRLVDNILFGQHVEWRPSAPHKNRWKHSLRGSVIHRSACQTWPPEPNSNAVNGETPYRNRGYDQNMLYTSSDELFFGTSLPKTMSYRDVAQTTVPFNKNEFIEQKGWMRCKITDNYRDSLQLGKAPRSVALDVTLDEYFRGTLPENLGPRAMVSEDALPTDLLVDLCLPEALCIRGGRLFAGRAGCVSDMHVDWFSHWLFVVNVFGHKKITLVPPNCSDRLLPLGSFSALDFRGIDKNTRAALLTFLDAVEVTLGPGDVLLQPPLWWHHVEYLDDSLTISIGAGRRNEYVSSFFRDARLPRDWRLINFYNSMLKLQYMDAAQTEACEQVREFWRNDTKATEAQKIDALARAIESISDGPDRRAIAPLHWCRLGLVGSK